MDARAAFAIGGLTAGSLFAARYRIVRLVAWGGMSAVYEVTDERTERRRALKVLLATLVHDAEAKRRFALEARITASVESPHVAEVLDSGVDEELGVPFLVTSLLDGSDLGALLRSKGTLSPGEVLGIVGQVASGLTATHAHGIVHRDLKPENLFLCKSGAASERIVIVDFGVAKSMERAGGTSTRSILGTPLYAAPEQIQFKRGEISPAADLYALGMVTYTLLVGEAYFAPEEEASDGTMQFFLEVVGGLREPAGARARRRREVDLPSAFDAWFARAVAVVPGDRFTDARSLDEGLRAVFAGSVPTEEDALPALAKTLVDVAPSRASKSEPMGSPTPSLTSGRTVSSAQARPNARLALAGLAIASALTALAWWARLDGVTEDGEEVLGDRQAPATTSLRAPQGTHASAATSRALHALATPQPADAPAASASGDAAAPPSSSVPAAASAAAKRPPAVPAARPPPPAPATTSAAPAPPRYVPPLLER